MSRIVSKTIDLSTLSGADEVKKYITKIDADGIKIHPNDWQNSQSDSYQNFVQIDSDGMGVYKNNVKVADFGANAVIGDESGLHIKITDSRLSFYRDGNNEVAYIDGDKLYITQSVVLQQMDVGRKNGYVDPITEIVGKGQWSWKVHEINGQNNLYLKWLG